jgi:hypothetical protein
MAIRKLSEVNAEKKTIEQSAQSQAAPNLRLVKVKKTAQIDITIPMTEMEARKAIKTLKNKASSLMKICYEFDARKGYSILGYKSFKECIEKELTGVIEYDYAHKMKNAGRVHTTILPDIPMGEIAEGVLRELYKVPSEKWREIWGVAVKKSGGDYTKVKGSILTKIIKSKGLGAPAKGDENKSKSKAKTSIATNDSKHDLDPKIILKTKLQQRMRSNALNLIMKCNARSNPHPRESIDSMKYFEKAVNIMLDDLYEFLLNQYESLYEQ